MSIAEIDIGATERLASSASCDDASSRVWIAILPRPLRFLAVGGIGLAADLCLFSIVAALGLNPLLARLVSLAFATCVTWRLNRMFTFARSGRHPGDEALRYAAVTTVAQGISYGVFAMLVLAMPHWLPQVALITGAAIGAIVSYTGHRWFSFLPRSVLAAYSGD